MPPIPYTKLKEQHLGPFTYLALGDSYTLGEGLEMQESFPFQLVKELKGFSLEFLPPRIIAKTGWTAKELHLGIEDAGISGKRFDLVTLLIGVNNQYRGESLNGFKQELSGLLDLAIRFANAGPANVILISIPDWGLTPFAIDGHQNSKRISKEIDQFNFQIQLIGQQKKVQFLDITNEYRQIGNLKHNVLSDQLHPTGAVYNGWAKSLRNLIVSGVRFQAIPS